MATLEKKAIDIKGNKYILVKDRILEFNKTYENGCIRTRIVSDDGEEVVFQAKVIPDTGNMARYVSGTASGVRGGKGVDETAAIENAETSAVGRALAMLGIGVMDSIASQDEVNKAVRGGRKATDSQKDYIRSLADKRTKEQLEDLGVVEDLDNLDNVSFAVAGKLISTLKNYKPPEESIEDIKGNIEKVKQEKIETKDLPF